METSGPKEGDAPLELSGRQLALLKALSQKETRLADFYAGALRVLPDTGNADRFAQACHSLRELMEQVPKRIAEVPAAEQLPRMGDKVRALATKWEQARRATACLNNGAWSGPIDGVMQEALGAIDVFFAWLEHDLPTRKDRTAGMLRKMDRMGVPLPAQIENLRIQEWSICREYFVGVAHHNSEATAEEVAKWVYALERFLLDLLKPRTFEKHEAIDSIIEQGERDAEPR